MQLYDLAHKVLKNSLACSSIHTYLHKFSLNSLNVFAGNQDLIWIFWLPVTKTAC